MNGSRNNLLVNLQYKNMNLHKTITQYPKKAGKLLGIELMRGLAAFAVVLAHSGDATWGSTTQGVVYLRNFFGFHVPFFLAISFYFLIRKSLQIKKQTNHIENLKKRSQRIILPYIVWSGIFLVFRTIFFSLSDNSQRLDQLYGDIPSILFLGGASYHIYFLPLLLTGTFVFFMLNMLVREWNLFKILAVFFGGIAMRSLVFGSGNSFQLGPNLAFQSFFEQSGIDPHAHLFLRLLSVFLAWAVRCLPYIGGALLIYYLESRFLNTVDDRQDSRSDAAHSIFFTNPFTSLCIASCTFLIATFSTTLPKSFRPFQSLVIAFSLVAIAFAISRIFLQGNTSWGGIVTNLGKCSLGIYLIHPLSIRSIRIVLSSIYPEILNGVSILSVSLISSSSFLVSWLVVHNMMRIKLLKQYIA